MVQLRLEILQARKVVRVGLFQFLNGIHLHQSHLTGAFLAAALLFPDIGLVCQIVFIFRVNVTLADLVTLSKIISARPPFCR